MELWRECSGEVEYFILEQTGITDYEYAKSLLLEHGQVREAVEHYRQ